MQAHEKYNALVDAFPFYRPLPVRAAMNAYKFQVACQRAWGEGLGGRLALAFVLAVPVFWGFAWLQS